MVVLGVVSFIHVRPLSLNLRGASRVDLELGAHEGSPLRRTVTSPNTVIRQKRQPKLKLDSKVGGVDDTPNIPPNKERPKRIVPMEFPWNGGFPQSCVALEPDTASLELGWLWHWHRTPAQNPPPES